MKTVSLEEALQEKPPCPGEAVHVSDEVEVEIKDKNGEDEDNQK